MARLATIKPQLATISTNRVKVLDTKAGATPRIRGGKWARTRERVALAHGMRCVECGCVWVPSRDQIDHEVPLEQGGSNEDSNLRPLCDECHKAKTAREASIRAG